MIRVTIDGLSRSYDGVSAVDGASLEIRPGELMTILGTSGSGKTVLARLIAGLETPDSGEIRFESRSLAGIQPHQRRVGFVPQDDALWPHQTVAENVGYGLRIKKIGRRDRRMRVSEALDAARIDSLGERRPDSLTPLQRQKVALARALIAEPELLLLDEPMARLDPRHRAELRDEILRIHSESETTTLILTADPREALALSNRLAILDFGKILQVGPPGEVYNRPVDGLVAQMLGPTNLIQGQVEMADARGDLVVRTPLGRLIGRCYAGVPAAGTALTVAIRPEAIAIGTSVSPGANRFAATIERQVLNGATRQVFLRGPGDWPITALALQAPSEGLREGQSLTAFVAPEHVVIMPGRNPRTA
jgi:ABC-type Fe3+/spermidine/putrescine transport system ATPase subunit